MQDEHINQIISKAEKEREEKFDKAAEIKRLKEEYVHLVEKKEHLLHQLQKHALYDELMEGVVHITQVLFLSNNANLKIQPEKHIPILLNAPQVLNLSCALCNHLTSRLELFLFVPPKN